MSRVLASCENERGEMEQALRQLQDHALVSIEVLPPALDMIFTFDEELALKVFTTFVSNGAEHWALLYPERRYFSVGPGLLWRDADEDMLSDEKAADPFWLGGEVHRA